MLVVSVIDVIQALLLLESKMFACCTCRSRSKVFSTQSITFRLTSNRGTVGDAMRAATLIMIRKRSGEGNATCLAEVIKAACSREQLGRNVGSISVGYFCIEHL